MKRKIISYLMFLIIGLFINGCSTTQDDTNYASYELENPIKLSEKKVYKFQMNKDDSHYFKFIPNETGYYSLMLGNDTPNYFSIEIYSDEDFTEKIKESYLEKGDGDYINYRMKENIPYYIKIVNDNVNYFANYHFLIVKSKEENGVFDKLNPLKFTLDKENINFLLKINYDSSILTTDDGFDYTYMVINSELTNSLYMKTLQINSDQDIDFKVFSDNNYSNEIYTTTSSNDKNESLLINFENNTTYYIKIQNFTNSESGFVKFSIDEINFD